MGTTLKSFSKTLLQGQTLSIDYESIKSLIGQNVKTWNYVGGDIVYELISDVTTYAADTTPGGIDGIGKDDNILLSANSITNQIIGDETHSSSTVTVPDPIVIPNPFTETHTFSSYQQESGTANIPIPQDLEAGNYYLQYISDGSLPIEESIIRIEITIGTIPSYINSSWPPIRPNNYDPEKFWDEDLGWTDIEVSGGGRYKNQIVVIGQTDLGNGCIYYGSS